MARAVGDLLISSCDRRIAAVLARLGSEAVGKPPAPLRLAQSVLGQMSNASRVRVNRTLREFETAGWVSVQYQSIRVTDVASLEAFARREG
jgi:CRP-like cAMP-binding protein